VNKKEFLYKNLERGIKVGKSGHKGNRLISKTKVCSPVVKRERGRRIRNHKGRGGKRGSIIKRRGSKNSRATGKLKKLEPRKEI